MATMDLNQQHTSSFSLTGTLRYVLPTLIENSLPFGIYFLVKGLTGASDVAALSLGALAPAVTTLWQAARTKRINVVSLLILLGILISLGAALLGGDPRLLLMRESVIGGLMGLIFLISLVFPRPLFFTLVQQIRAGRDAQKRALFEQRWQQPSQRRAYRLVTAVWGVSMVGEFILRAAMVMTLPVALVVTLTTFIPLCIYGATVAWTIWYLRRA